MKLHNKSLSLLLVLNTHCEDQVHQLKERLGFINLEPTELEQLQKDFSRLFSTIQKNATANEQTNVFDRSA